MANLQQVRAINNPQRAYMWEIQIRALSTGALQNLDAYAKTVSIPESAVEQMIINFKGGRSHHAGRDTSAHTATITFWDDERKTILNFFQNWMDNLIMNPLTGGGVTRELYSASISIRLKSADDSSVTSEIVLGHAFPTNIGEIALSYDTSEAVEIPITFSYDEKILL